MRRSHYRLRVEHVDQGIVKVSRVMCYGVCGSGKTTLAENISRRTGLQWHSADDLTWLPGWQMVPDDEQKEKIRSVVDQDAWILDTAYGKWLELPMGRVELIVALDYPRWFSFWRLFRRSIARAVDKRPVCNGNTESWRNMFSNDSILLWHFRSYKNKRRRIYEWLGQQDSPSVIILRSALETERWLGSLEPATGRVEFSAP